MSILGHAIRSSAPLLVVSLNLYQSIRRKIMQYMLLIYGAESGFASMSKDALQKMYAGYMAVSKEMGEAGVMQGGAELLPVSSATTMRVRNGKALTTDGPFAETKEQLGGYYLIDVPNLDEALKWAAKIPGAHDGSVEVRPLAPEQS
jgi:hypothetical protein